MFQYAVVSWTDPDNDDNISTDAAYEDIDVTLEGDRSFDMVGSMLTFTGSANHEVQDSYDVDVVATDEDGLQIRYR